MQFWKLVKLMRLIDFFHESICISKYNKYGYSEICNYPKNYYFGITIVCLSSIIISPKYYYNINR